MPQGPTIAYAQIQACKQFWKVKECLRVIPQHTHGFAARKQLWKVNDCLRSYQTIHTVSGWTSPSTLRTVGSWRWRTKRVGWKRLTTTPAAHWRTPTRWGFTPLLGHSVTHFLWGYLYSVGTYQGNELERNWSGKVLPQSSQLAELL